MKSAFPCVRIVFFAILMAFAVGNAYADYSITFPATTVTSAMTDTLDGSVKRLTGAAGYHSPTDASTYTTYLTIDSAVGISYNIKMAKGSPAYSATAGLDVPLTTNWQIKDLSSATAITFYAKSSAANIIHLIIGSDAYDATTAAAGAALTSSDIKITTSWKLYTIDITDLTMSSWYSDCAGDCLSTGWDKTNAISIGSAVKTLNFQPVLDGGWNSDGLQLSTKSTGDFYIKDINIVGASNGTNGGGSNPGTNGGSNSTTTIDTSKKWVFKNFERADTGNLSGMIPGTSIRGASYATNGTTVVSSVVPSDDGVAGWDENGNVLSATFTASASDSSKWSSNQSSACGFSLATSNWEPMDLRRTILSFKIQDLTPLMQNDSMVGSDVRVTFHSAYGDAKLKADTGITPGFYLSMSSNTAIKIPTDTPKTVSFLVSNATYPKWVSSWRYPTASLDSILATVTSIAIEATVSGTAKTIFVDDFKFTGIDSTGPVAPAVSAHPTTPASNASGIDQGIAFKWAKYATDGSTEFQLSKHANFDTTALDTFVWQDSSNLVFNQNLSYGTKYYWRVRSLGAGGWAGWNADSFATINPKLTQPVVVSPTVGQTTWKTSYAFKWDTIVGADSIRIQIAKNGRFDSILTLDTVVKYDTSYTPTTASVLNWSTTYKVRIKALAADGDFSAYSQPITFTTLAPPPTVAPSSLAPAGIGTLQDTALVLSGTYMANLSDSIEVQLALSSDVNFASTLIDTVLIRESKDSICWRGFNSTTMKDSIVCTYNWDSVYTFVLNVKGLAYGKTYAWRARAKNGTDGGPWTKVLIKTLADTISQGVTITAPVNKATNVSRSVIPTWTVNGTTSSTDSIVLQVSRNPNFQGTSWNYSSSTTLDTTHIYASRALLSTASDSSVYKSFNSYGYGLDTVATYYMRARRRTSKGYSAWTVDTFTTVYAAPTQGKRWLISPNIYNTAITGNGSNVPANTTLVWNRNSRADSFEVVLWHQSYSSKNYVCDTLLHDTVADTVATISGLKNDSTYYWLVRPKSNAAGWGAWWAYDTSSNRQSYNLSNNYNSYPASFVVVTAAPTAPIQTSPATGAAKVDKDNVSLVWNYGTTSKVDSIIVQWSSTRNFTADVTSKTLRASIPIYNATYMPATSSIVSGLNNLTQYFWRIKAFNRGGSSDWALDSFTTKVGIPGVPALVSPANNTSDVLLNQTLNWTHDNGVDNDSVEVSTDSRFVSVNTIAFTTTLTSTTVSGLVNSSTYYWRVKSNNSTGSSVWSAVGTFTTVGLPPSVPTLTLPVNGKANASVNLTLAWNIAARATTYRIQVSKMQTFGSNVMDTTITATDTSVALKGLDYGTAYYWRVLATNKGGSSDWSLANTLTTLVAPPFQPVLIEPAAGAKGVLTEPIIRWNKAKYATGYEIQVATDTGFTAVVNDALSSDTAVAVSGLVYLTKYYCRVQSRNSGGFSDWSALDSFTTLLDVPTAPAAISPVGGVTKQAVTVPLMWHKTSYTDSYEVEIATDIGFTAIVKDSLVKDSVLSGLSLSNLTTYYWRVRSVNAAGSSSWLTKGDFTTIVAAPAVPALLSPKGGTSGVALNSILSWYPLANVDSVEVQVDTSAEFKTPKSLTTEGSATNLTFALSQYMTYYWRARAKNDAGISNWSSVRTFRTLDTAKPVFSEVPAAIAAYTDAGKSYATVTWTAPTAIDNAGVASLTSTSAPGSKFLAGITKVTYTAVDSTGNTTTASFTVTVTDTSKPVFSGIPTAITAVTDAGKPYATVTWTAPIATDNGGVASLTSDFAPGSQFRVGTTKVTYTATDSTGNSATASFTVTVTDTAKPILSGVPTAITAVTDPGKPYATVTWTAPTATDNVGIASLTSNHASGSKFWTGVTTVIYTATDSAGNSVTGNFTIAVADTEKPVLTNIPAQVTAVLGDGETTATVTWTAPTAIDNAGVASLMSTYAPGSKFPVGTTKVTYTVTDSAGNTTSGSFNVIVNEKGTGIDESLKPIPTVHLLDAAIPSSFGKKASIGRLDGRLGLGSDGAGEDGNDLSVNILLPETGSVFVNIFDNLGSPVISWNRTLSESDINGLTLTQDRRRIAPITWNLRAADGRAVPEGVYLWKVRVITTSGQKLENVFHLGVKSSD